MPSHPPLLSSVALALESPISPATECLFAPLTGIEVLRTRVEGRTLVIEARLSVNLNALTIEQVISKRKKLVLDMSDSLPLEVQASLSGRTRGHFTSEGEPMRCCETQVVLAADECRYYKPHRGEAGRLSVCKPGEPSPRS
jgi:hypothetical protein